MSSKLELLQELLSDRDQVVVLYRGQAHCSCGEIFTDFCDIENHLVQRHEKLSPSRSTSSKSLPLVLKDIVNSLSTSMLTAKSSDQQLDIVVPAGTLAVCLDEASIQGGLVSSMDCHLCFIQCYSFKTLKDHYLRQHPGTWACPETCRQVQNLTFQKPSSGDKSIKHKSLQYFCPLPACKYHVSQCQAQISTLKAFSSYSQLKQHYSKMHASREKKCAKCGMGKKLCVIVCCCKTYEKSLIAGFATDVYLKRHKKLTCGRSFSCQTCAAVFSALENLQTHCRRKSHPLGLEYSSSVSSRPPTKKLKAAPSKSYPPNRFVKIAPMPSLTMTAALALSEMSTKDPSSEAKKQQQQAVMTPEKLRPHWSASTQTSPRGDQAPVVAEMSEESILKTSARSCIPKLGEIEQFSTETQTDDLELLLKPSIGTVTSSHAATEDAFTIEAQTQFDLDDILCSNYTQTALFDTSLDHQSQTVNSAETQTMLMSYDLVNMETQTMSMLFDTEDVNT